MATAAPERPSGNRNNRRSRARRRTTGKFQSANGKNAFEKSPVLGSENRLKNRIVKGNVNLSGGKSALQEPSPSENINEDGGVGEDAYGPELPMNEDGGVGSQEYGPELPQSEVGQSDTDEEPQSKSKKTEPDVEKAEKDASPQDGQDDSGVLNSEGFANDPDKGAWANATRQAGRNAGIKAENRGYRKLTSRKGIFAIIGTVGVALTVVGAVLTIPQLALNNALDKLTGPLSDRLTFAVEKRFEKYVGRYVTKSVVPTLDACGQTLKPTCVKVDTSTGLTKRFITGWNDARIESRLERKHGITFQKNINSPDTDIIKNGRKVGSAGPRSLSREALNIIKADATDLTLWDKILLRRDVRSVTKRYGGIWCSGFAKVCKGLDTIEAKKLSWVKRKKLQLVARVVEPASARASAFFFCMIEGCSPERLKTAGTQEALSILNKADDEGFKRIVSEIGDQRVSQYLFDKAIKSTLGKLFPRISTLGATQSVLVVGQIYLAFYIVDILDLLDEAIDNNAISDFNYDRNIGAVVNGLSTVSSAIEESQAGAVSYGEIGGNFELLNGYTESRYYQSLVGGIPGNSLECNDDYVVAVDSPELVCPELNLRREVKIEEIRDDPTVDTLAEFAFGPYRRCIAQAAPGIGDFLPVDFSDIPLVGNACPETREVIRPILRSVDGVLGAIGGFIIDAIGTIPGVDDLIGAATRTLGDAVNWVIEKSFPLAFDANAVGWKMFDQMAAGFDYLYNQVLGGYVDEDGQQQGFGAGEISTADAAELDLAIAEWNNEKLQSQSFFARYLDPTNYDSLASTAITRLSTILPFGGAPLNLSFNPAGAFSSVGNLFGGNALAATPGAVYSQQHFGNTQYAFTLEQLETDPDTLTPEYCEQEKAAYREARAAGGSASSICMLDEGMIDLAHKAFSPDPPGSDRGSFGIGTTETTLENLDGQIIPCDIDRQGGLEYVRKGDGADWSNIAPSGKLGGTTLGKPINVYVREACQGVTNPRTIVIGSSIHGSENGGQLISHELLFNLDLPDDVRIVAIPEINGDSIQFSKRKNARGAEDNPGNTSRGVDLNRNWDYLWTQAGSTDTSSSNYRGPAAESEPETQAVANFLRSVGKSSLFISYHDNIDWVAPVDQQSEPIARAYAGYANNMQVGNDNGQIIVKGKGYMEAWYNEETGSPALLVELTNERSSDYITLHAEAVARLVRDDVVR